MRNGIERQFKSLGNDGFRSLGLAYKRLGDVSRIFQLLPPSEKLADKDLGRNLLTRTLDTAFALVRKYLPPIHWLLAAMIATVLFLYVQMVAVTARLVTTGSRPWPHVPVPSVLALWHRDAPSLLVAFAKGRPHARTVIMIARDPRGDYLALLCRLVGLGVIRGDSEEGAGTLCYNWPMS